MSSAARAAWRCTRSAGRSTPLCPARHGQRGAAPLICSAITGNLNAANIFAKTQISASVLGGSGRDIFCRCQHFRKPNTPNGKMRYVGCADAICPARHGNEHKRKDAVPRRTRYILPCQTFRISVKAQNGKMRRYLAAFCRKSKSYIDVAKSNAYRYFAHKGWSAPRSGCSGTLPLQFQTAPQAAFTFCRSAHLMCLFMRIIMPDRRL